MKHFFQKGNKFGKKFGFQKGHPDLVPKEKRGHSEETRKNISLAKKGKPNGRLGKHHSEETKRKISLSHIGKPRLDITGEKCWLWKGGITPLIRQIRNCFRMRQWRSDVFQRDELIFLSFFRMMFP